MGERDTITREEEVFIWLIVRHLRTMPKNLRADWFKRLKRQVDARVDKQISDLEQEGKIK